MNELLTWSVAIVASAIIFEIVWMLFRRKHSSTVVTAEPARCILDELKWHVPMAEPKVWRYFNITRWCKYVELACAWRPGFIRYVCPGADLGTCGCSSRGLRVPHHVSHAFWDKRSSDKAISLRFAHGESLPMNLKMLEHWSLDWDGFRCSPVVTTADTEEE